MKILFVSSSRKGNGISPFIQAQGESLMQLGISIDFYLIPGQGLRGYWAGFKDVRKMVKHFGYNLVHAHFGISGLVTKLASPRNSKIVVSFLGDDLAGTVNQQGSYTWLGRVIVLLNQIFARYFFSYNIVKSEFLSAKLKSVKNKVVIPNGVNLDVFYPINKTVARARLGLGNDKKYVFFAANPKRPVKNFKLLIESEKYKRRDYIILIPEAFTKEEMNLHYNAADVVILTSHHEGSPNAVKEAMACNRPIVATDVGDIKWLFGSLQGHFITQNSATSLAKNLEDAFAFSESFESTKGRERLVDLSLDDKSIALKIIYIYKTLLS